MCKLSIKAELGRCKKIPTARMIRYLNKSHLCFPNWILKSKALHIPMYFLILIQSLNNQVENLPCVKKYVHSAIKTQSWSKSLRILLLLYDFLCYKTELSTQSQS